MTKISLHTGGVTGSIPVAPTISAHIPQAQCAASCSTEHEHAPSSAEKLGASDHHSFLLTADEQRAAIDALFDRCSPEPNTGCWLWLGSVSGDGYGRMGDVGAHRVAWAIRGGQIPPGMMVLHHCDQPLCVNPDHLRLGTAAENSADKVRRGRDAAVRVSRLSEADMVEVMRLASQGATHRSIGERFGVSRKLVERAIARHRSRFPSSALENANV